MTHDFVCQDLKLDIFLICPVREATDEEKDFLRNYRSKLEEQGHKVYYPETDTKQKDPSGGYQICTDNSAEIRNSDEVHVYWNKNSKGSLFDLGNAFSEHKTRDMPIRLANRKDVESIVEERRREYIEKNGEEPQNQKSFEQVLLKLDDYAGFVNYSNK